MHGSLAECMLLTVLSYLSATALAATNAAEYCQEGIKEWSRMATANAVAVRYERTVNNVHSTSGPSSRSTTNDLDKRYSRSSTTWSTGGREQFRSRMKKLQEELMTDEETKGYFKAICDCRRQATAGLEKWQLTPDEISKVDRIVRNLGPSFVRLAYVSAATSPALLLLELQRKKVKEEI